MTSPKTEATEQKTKRKRPRPKYVTQSILSGGPIELDAEFIEGHKWLVYSVDAASIGLIEADARLTAATRLLINFDGVVNPFDKKNQVGSKIKGSVLLPYLLEAMVAGLLGFDVDNPKVHLFECTIEAKAKN